MKAFFFLFLISFSAMASDQKLCAYLKENTFEYFGKKVVVHNVSKSFKELVKKVSAPLDQERSAECKAERLNVDRHANYCHWLCVEYGTSDYRLFAYSVTQGMVELNKKTNNCLNLCEAYKAYALSFEDGLKNARK